MYPPPLPDPLPAADDPSILPGIVGALPPTNLDEQIKNAELEKLNEEIRKLRTERLKTSREAKGLKRRFLPYAQVVMTPIASGLVLLGTLYFGRQWTQLEMEKSAALQGKKAIEAERDALRAEVTGLRKERVALTHDVETKQQEVQTLDNQLQSLRSDAALGNLRGFVAKLSQAPNDSDATAFKRAMLDVVQETDRTKDKAERALRIQYLRERAQEEDDPAVRAYLHIALARITRNPQHVKDAMSIARQRFYNHLHYVRLAFLNLEEFDAANRAEYLCSGHPLNFPPELILEFDRQALALCPAPYYALVQTTIRDTKAVATEANRNPRASSFDVERRFDLLARLSPQAAVCTWLEAGQLPAAVKVLSLRTGEAPDEVKRFLSTPGDRRLAQEWLVANKPLCDLWLEPDLKRLQDSAPGTMLRVLDGHWVNLNSVPMRGKILAPAAK